MLMITESAKNQLETLAKTNNKWGIKIAVKGGGCAGFTYDWSFLDSAEDLTEGDETIIVGESNFVVDGMSLMYLIGTQLDFKSEIFGSSFAFENPNASSSCGCGTSFALDRN
jgi:iron-sulfur cluster insertion protein